MAIGTIASTDRADFERDGFLIKKALLGSADVETLESHFMELHGRRYIAGCFESDPDATDPLKVYPRMMHPHRVSEIAKRYMLHPGVFDTLADLLGEEPIAAQSMFYFKPPGARGQALHQDNFYLKVEPGTCVAAWVAIDRVDPENGGLFVVPGSQDMDIVCPEQADPEVSFTTHFVRPPEGLEPVPISLDPGDVLFFNGSLIHGSYPNNSSDRFRRSFICHYAGKSCRLIGRGYMPLHLRDGTPVWRDANAGAGPCGEEFDR